MSILSPKFCDHLPPDTISLESMIGDNDGMRNGRMWSENFRQSDYIDGSGTFVVYAWMVMHWRIRPRKEQSKGGRWTLLKEWPGWFFERKGSRYQPKSLPEHWDLVYQTWGRPRGESGPKNVGSINISAVDSNGQWVIIAVSISVSTFIDLL